MSKRTKWTRDVVEAMWAAMEAKYHLRKQGQMDSWWQLIAATLNDEFNLGLTGKACATKAGEVHKAKRPYPWDADAATANKIKHPTQPHTSDTETRDALFELTRRFDRLERNLIDLVEGRVVGTPDIKPAINQLWVSRTKLRQTNNEHCHMRIAQIDGNEATLEEVGGTFVYTLPVRNIHRFFSHVGFANPRAGFVQMGQAPAPVNTAEPLQLPQAPIKSYVFAKVEGAIESNKHRDLNELMGD